ncbi:MAG: carboxylesterase family protein [Bacteroidaceae bacterium]|nr:carboxylesterase family protein [Bacteroidaceae bacterium]
MIITKLGKIEGVDMGDYMEYRGVPYAKPPVGELRWKAPEPVEPWEGILEAKEYGNCCVQQPTNDPMYTKEFYDDPVYDRTMSEDCLYVNIWTPKAAEEDRKWPVAVWFHGGAFLGGYATEKEFDGKEYCARGVILVSVEYRCNIFGYLAHPWLSEENENHRSGNYGTLDQIAALKWVYDNIEAFGGDHDNITIFGQSAGAMSVQTLISSPLAQNMVSKAIMQSGGSYEVGLHTDIPLKIQEEYGLGLSEVLKVNNLKELRAKSTEEIISSLGEFMGATFPKSKGLFLTPTMDDYVLEDGYYKLMDEGRIAQIPYMVGCTKNDILAEPGTTGNIENTMLYKGSVNFALKAEEFSCAPTYVYGFSRDLPGDEAGAFHSSELWYTFGSLSRCWRPMEEHDYELSEKMLDCWTNFMKTGNPNKEGSQEWEPCTKENNNVYIFQ